jgi:hypothetical protein
MDVYWSPRLAGTPGSWPISCWQLITQMSRRMNQISRRGSSLRRKAESSDRDSASAMRGEVKGEKVRPRLGTLFPCPFSSWSASRPLSTPREGLRSRACQLLTRRQRS